MFKIMMHDKNQYGFAVSLTKYEGDELISGFTLNSFKSVYEQQKYALEFAELTGFVMEHDHD